MNKEVHKRISKKVEEIAEAIIATRRHFHTYPELSDDERETSFFVAEKLKILGFTVQTNIGGYGVVGILKGEKPGATIAWRADMDACPIQEMNDVPYKSKIDGIMHVCGHDAHTAIALGIAESLSSVKEELRGTVKFIFQPSEENLKGALRMIKDGVLNNPSPVAVYGLHQGSLGENQTYMEAGKLALIYRTALFGTDTFEINIKVKRLKFNGWAEQELLICKLNDLNRCVNPFGKRNIDHLVNFEVLEKKANDDTGQIKIKAKFRYAMQEYRDIIRKSLSKILDDYVTEWQSDVRLEYLKSVPPIYNDERECEEAELILRELIDDNLVPIHEVPVHGGDDYSYFQDELSGLFFFLGSANLQKGLKGANHTSTFDIDEDCLTFAVKTMSSFLFEILERKHL